MLHVTPTRMTFRIPPQDCLEDSMDKNGFSSDCKEELDAQLAKRVTDFRLDTELRSACDSDLMSVCGVKVAEMDQDDDVRKSAINCLQVRLRGGSCGAPSA